MEIRNQQSLVDAKVLSAGLAARRIEFVDALPRNATGKIHKPTLRKNFGASSPTDTQAIAS